MPGLTLSDICDSGTLRLSADDDDDGHGDDYNYDGGGDGDGDKHALLMSCVLGEHSIKDASMYWH